MTTIAFKDGVIAYDSFATAGGTVVDRNYSKKRVVDGVTFIFCGMPAEMDELIGCYFGNSPTKELESHALVVDSGEVYHIGIEGETLYKHRVTNCTSVAIGSGWHHAYTAMDLGCSAKKAVQMAALRDCGSGGKINTFKVKTGK